MYKKQIKYLYCLVSSPKDVFYEQAYISIISLKIHMPDAYIILFTDNETIISIKKRKADIRNIVDEIIFEYFDNKISNLKRSRILKTLMRNKVDGDFLYIDSDTIISHELNEIEDMNIDLGAVLDMHTLFSLHIHYLWFKKYLKVIYNNEDFYNYHYYFNGGLLFVRDTQFNKEFFKKWNENYYLGCKKGILLDMPSLALTNYQLGFPIKELNGKWNVQVWAGVNYLNDAKIIHYLGNENDYEPFTSIIPHELKDNGYLTEKNLSIISHPKSCFGEAAITVVGNDYEIYRSNINAFLRKLYKLKYLFKFIDKIFILPRIIKFNYYLRKNKKE